MKNSKMYVIISKQNEVIARTAPPRPLSPPHRHRSVHNGSRPAGFQSRPRGREQRPGKAAGPRDADTCVDPGHAVPLMMPPRGRATVAQDTG